MMCMGIRLRRVGSSVKVRVGPTGSRKQAYVGSLKRFLYFKMASKTHSFLEFAAFQCHPMMLIRIIEGWQRSQAVLLND
jgi:hypothetical protein